MHALPVGAEQLMGPESSGELESSSKPQKPLMHGPLQQGGKPLQVYPSGKQLGGGPPPQVPFSQIPLQHCSG
jgi:hypothetical protein